MLTTQINQYQPDHILHLLFDGAQEMLGLDQLQQVWGLPGRFTAPISPNGEEPFSYAGLPDALERVYGTAGGQGLALRIGRSMFKYLLQRKGDALGLTSAEFYLQRAPQRAKSGLHLLAEQLAKDSGDQIRIQEEEQHWVWRSERCPVCWGRQTGQVSCYLTAGLIQEFMAWAGGGRYYRVVERECRAAGAAACTFWIDKRPLD